MLTGSIAVSVYGVFAIALGVGLGSLFTGTRLVKIDRPGRPELWTALARVGVWW